MEGPLVVTSNYTATIEGLPALCTGFGALPRRLRHRAVRSAGSGREGRARTVERNGGQFHPQRRLEAGPGDDEFPSRTVSLHFVRGRRDVGRPVLRLLHELLPFMPVQAKRLVEHGSDVILLS